MRTYKLQLRATVVLLSVAAFLTVHSQENVQKDRVVKDDSKFMAEGKDLAECNKECEEYCKNFFPTKGCIAACGCKSEGGSTLKKKNLLELSQQSEEEQGTCVSLCSLKCNSELPEKQKSCVNLCVLQCQAYYDYSVNDQFAPPMLEPEQEPLLNDTQSGTENKTTSEAEAPATQEGQAAQNESESLGGNENQITEGNQTTSGQEAAKNDSLDGAAVSSNESDIEALVLKQIIAQETICDPLCMGHCGSQARLLGGLLLTQCFKEECKCSLWGNENLRKSFTSKLLDVANWSMPLENWQICMLVVMTIMSTLLFLHLFGDLVVMIFEEFDMWLFAKTGYFLKTKVPEETYLRKYIMKMEEEKEKEKSGSCYHLIKQ